MVQGFIVTFVSMDTLKGGVSSECRAVNERFRDAMVF